MYNGTGSILMNVTPRSVRVTMIAVEKKQVLHILKVCP